MLRIGITGGIGTGKTTVCKIFELLGISIFYADDIAKKLYDNNNQLKSKIIEHFGDEIYKPDPADTKRLIFNKEKMKSIIFNNPEQLKLLNSLVHPIIKLEADRWFAKQSAPYSIKEAALIIESNSFENLDELILIESPIAIRMKRIALRDHLNSEEIHRRIQSQLPEDEKKKYATQTIVNDENTLLIPQVISLHRYFLEKAKQ